MSFADSSFRRTGPRSIFCVLGPSPSCLHEASVLSQNACTWGAGCEMRPCGALLRFGTGKPKCFSTRVHCSEVGEAVHVTTSMKPPCPLLRLNGGDLASSGGSEPPEAMGKMFLRTACKLTFCGRRSKVFRSQQGPHNTPKQSSH